MQDGRSIALVLGGGTIGSASTSSVKAIRVAPKNTEAFLDVLVSGLVGLFPTLHAAGLSPTFSNGPVSLSLPSNRLQPTFSENAGPSTWNYIVNAILQAARAEPDLRAIIVTHGTDTMAQSVPAVQYAIERCSIPIIFVGSNTPLLDDSDAVYSGDLSACRSDAWDNLMQAILFATLCGPSVPGGVYLSFSGRIHYPINLSKLPQNDRPQHFPIFQRKGPVYTASPASVRIDQEPFAFSNALSRGRYAYRFLNGTFVYNSTYDGERAPRDISGDPEPNEPANKATVVADSRAYEKSDDFVRQVSASPCAGEIGQLPVNTRCVLVHAYDSGTAPTRKDHPFWDIYERCVQRDIPMFFASRNGIETGYHYEWESMPDSALSIHRFRAMIPESACPLLTLACQRIAPDEWRKRSSGLSRGALIAEKARDILRSAIMHSQQFPHQKLAASIDRLSLNPGRR